MKRESGRGRWRVVWGQQRLLDWGLFGAWLSLVERLVRDQEAGGSNPLAPTNPFNDFRRFRARRIPNCR
jgi:hypothetical protein